MNRRMLFLLVKFCKKHGIDTELIDNTLDYHEAKAELEKLVVQEPEELAEDYGKVYEEMQEAIPEHETYGVDFRIHQATGEEIFVVKMYAILRYSFKALRNRQQLEIQRRRTKLEVLKGYVDLCRKCPLIYCKARTRLTITKRVIKIQGIAYGIATVQKFLEERNIYYKVVKLKRHERGLQYVSGYGYVHSPLFSVGCYPRQEKTDMGVINAKGHRNDAIQRLNTDSARKGKK